MHIQFFFSSSPIAIKLEAAINAYPNDYRKKQDNITFCRVIPLKLISIIQTLKPHKVHWILNQWQIKDHNSAKSLDSVASNKVIHNADRNIWLQVNGDSMLDIKTFGISSHLLLWHSKWEKTNPQFFIWLCITVAAWNVGVYNLKYVSGPKSHPPYWYGVKIRAAEERCTETELYASSRQHPHSHNRTTKCHILQCGQCVS